MSTEVESPAQTAESTPAPEPQGPSFADRSQKWTATERDHFDLTGDEPAISAEPATGKNETEAAPVVQEPKRELSVEDRSRRDKERSEIRQSEFFKRKAASLERELAEAKAQRPEAAPGTSTATDQRPVRPKLSDPGIDGDIDKWEAALDVHEVKSAEWNRQQWKRDTETERQARETADLKIRAEAEVDQMKSSWLDRSKPVREANPKFDMMFNEIAPLLDRYRPLVGDAIARHKRGPEIVIHLHQTEGAMEALLDMPESLAVAEIGVITTKLAKAPIPKKETSAPDPPARLGGKDESVDGPKPGSRAWIDAENEADAKRILAGS